VNRSQSDFITYNIPLLADDIERGRVTLLLPNVGSSIEAEIMTSKEPSLQRLHSALADHKTVYEVNTTQALHKMLDNPCSL
jgi:hypothetical protein